MTEMTDAQIWRGLEHYVRTSSTLTRLQPIMHDCVLAFCVSRVAELEAAVKGEPIILKRRTLEAQVEQLFVRVGTNEVQIDELRKDFEAAQKSMAPVSPVTKLIGLLRTDLKAHVHFDRTDDAFIGSTGKCYYP